jgi:hypothetical protein
MRVMHEGKAYHIPYGMAACDTCKEWYECAAHNDRWHECRLLETFSNDFAGREMKQLCPHAQEITQDTPFKRQHYKAEYIWTTQGRTMVISSPEHTGQGC